MAKFEFNKPYKDAELKREVKAGEEVEMTIKRADEVVKNIKEQAEKNPRFKAYKDFEHKRLDVPDSKADGEEKKEDKKAAKDEKDKG